MLHSLVYEIQNAGSHEQIENSINNLFLEDFNDELEGGGVFSTTREAASNAASSIKGMSSAVVKNIKSIPKKKVYVYVFIILVFTFVIGLYLCLMSNSWQSRLLSATTPALSAQFWSENMYKIVELVSTKTGFKKPLVQDTLKIILLKSNVGLDAIRSYSSIIVKHGKSITSLTNKIGSTLALGGWNSVKMFYNMMSYIFNQAAFLGMVYSGYQSVLSVKSIFTGLQSLSNLDVDFTQLDEDEFVDNTLEENFFDDDKMKLTGKTQIFGDAVFDEYTNDKNEKFYKPRNNQSIKNETGKTMLDNVDQHSSFVASAAGGDHTQQSQYAGNIEQSPQTNEGGNLEYNDTQLDGGKTEHEGGKAEHEGGKTEHEGGKAEHEGGKYEHEDSKKYEKYDDDFEGGFMNVDSLAEIIQHGMGLLESQMGGDDDEYEDSDPSSSDVSDSDDENYGGYKHKDDDDEEEEDEEDEDDDDKNSYW